MNVQELRELGADELVKKELELREKLFKLKFQHSIRPIDDPNNLRVIRRDIARIKTVLNETL